MRPGPQAAAAIGLLLALALAAVAAVAQEGQRGAGQGPGPAVTLLLHHPADGDDPLGRPFDGQLHYMAARYPGLFAQGYDYPVFLADGIVPVEGVPDVGRPYDSVREAYEAAVAQREVVQAPVVLSLRSSLADGAARVEVALAPAPGLFERARVRVAVAEDPVHYEPPAGLANGITEHRFTVRAVADAGEADLAGPFEEAVLVPLQDGWQRDRLLVAAWVQVGADGGGSGNGTGGAGGRFAPHEVLQATHAPLGQQVTQSGKGVLVELLSATWCDPCLFGDLAAQDLAVARGAAEPLAAEAGARYLVRGPWWAAAGAALAAAAAWALAGRAARGPS